MAKVTKNEINSRQTWSLLGALQALNAPVSLYLIDKDTAIKGRILAVDAARGALMLDIPQLLADPAGRPQTWFIDAQIDGRLLEFSCVLHRRVSLEEGPAFVAQQPQLLSDRQRRGAFRVRIPAAESMQAAIAERNGTLLQAQLTDISISGFGAEASSLQHMQDGVKVHCKITLPDVAMFVDATVRHHGAREDFTHIGLQFTEITSVLETLLSQTILTLERKNLRTRDD